MNGRVGRRTPPARRRSLVLAPDGHEDERGGRQHHRSVEPPAQPPQCPPPVRIRQGCRATHRESGRRHPPLGPAHPGRPGAPPWNLANPYAVPPLGRSSQAEWAVFARIRLGWPATPRESGLGAAIRTGSRAPIVNVRNEATPLGTPSAGRDEHGVRAPSEPTSGEPGPVTAPLPTPTPRMRRGRGGHARAASHRM